MRRVLAALLPWLMLLPLACSSATESAVAPCPTPAAELPALPPAPDLPASEVSQTIWQGARTLEAEYVDELNRVTLLEDAWTGTAAWLQQRGIAIPGDIDPNRDKAQRARDREAQVRTALDKLPDVAGSALTPQQIVELALTQMAASLRDGHTGFLTRSQWIDRLQNRASALGYERIAYGDGLVVTGVLPGSNAEKQGLEPGDLIMAVNGYPFSSGQYAGPALSSSHPNAYTIIRRGDEEREIQISLRPVALPAEPHRLIGTDIGLIRLYNFPSAPGCDYITPLQTALDAALDDLERGGARAWILDLRNNPGGAVQSAALVAGTFGYDGVLLNIRGRGASRLPVETTGTTRLEGAPLAVLVNGRSASSSEVTAFVLQESRRAHIVGVRTAGEVAASREYPIAGGGLAITTGHVDVGPSQTIVQNTGVNPDTRVELDLRLLANEARDSQLEAAVEYLRSKLR